MTQEALKYLQAGAIVPVDMETTCILVNALKEVLAQEQEPVIDKSAAIRIATSLGWSPQRTWVGLTYEDMTKLQKDLYDAKGKSVLPTTFARAIEAKLKEKNT